MIAKNNIKTNDIVYSIDSWINNIIKAKVTEIVEVGVLFFQHICFVDINWIKFPFSHCIKI